MKLGELIKRIVTLVASAFVFISLAFPFVTYSAANDITNIDYSFSDWMDTIANANNDWIGWWKVAEVLYIIALVVAGLLILAVVCQFFFKDNRLNSAVRILGISLIVLMVLAFGCYLIGQISSSSTIEIVGEKVTSTYKPLSGMIVMLISGLIAGTGALLLKETSSKKSKKRK